MAKGSNFAITPNTIPVEDIISNVEAANRSLPDVAAEEIRAETTRILRKAKTPKCNIKKSEITALKELNTNEDILNLPVDKDTADYKQKT